MMLLTAALTAVFQAGGPQSGWLTVMPQAARQTGCHQTTVDSGTVERVPTDGDVRRSHTADRESGGKKNRSACPLGEPQSAPQPSTSQNVVGSRGIRVAMMAASVQRGTGTQSNARARLTRL